jgi:plasmid maintenance system antidote protein VapI
MATERRLTESEVAAMPHHWWDGSLSRDEITAVCAEWRSLRAERDAAIRSANVANLAVTAMAATVDEQTRRAEAAERALDKWRERAELLAVAALRIAPADVASPATNECTHRSPITRQPAEAFPTGDFVAEEVHARGWSIHELAERARLDVAAVDEILNAVRPITPREAFALRRAFGTSAEYWQNLDAAYWSWRECHPSKPAAPCGDCVGCETAAECER